MVFGCKNEQEKNVLQSESFPKKTERPPKLFAMQYCIRKLCEQH